MATIRIGDDQCLWQYVWSVDYPADSLSRCCELKSLVEFDCEVTVCSTEPRVKMTSCDTPGHLIKTIFFNDKLRTVMCNDENMITGRPISYIVHR